MSMTLKVVTSEAEREFTFEELGLPYEATDNEILEAAHRKLDQDLEGYVVSRQGQNVLVSPSPVFG